MSEQYPFRMVQIQGATAEAFKRAPQETMTVKGAEDMDRALGDPGNSQHCGLCNEFFGIRAFVQHAPGCIVKNGPAWERQRDIEPPHRKKGRKLNVYR